MTLWEPPASQDGSLGNEEEADSTQEAGVEFYNMNGLMTRKGGRSLVFHCDGEDQSVVQPSTNMGSQEQEELDLRVDFGKPEDVVFLILILSPLYRALIFDCITSIIAAAQRRFRVIVHDLYLCVLCVYLVVLLWQKY